MPLNDQVYFECTQREAKKKEEREGYEKGIRICPLKVSTEPLRSSSRENLALQLVCNEGCLIFKLLLMKVSTEKKAVNNKT